MKARIVETIVHFKIRLFETPLLLVWLVAGQLVALVVDGWLGLAFGLTNLLLAGVYALIIRLNTPNPPLPRPVKRPRLELLLALGLFGLFLLTQILDFGVWNIQPLQGGVQAFFAQVRAVAGTLPGVPDWARQDLAIALSSTVKKLLPTLLLFLLLGYGPRAMGLTNPHWKLTAILVGLTALFGLFTGVLTRAPITQVIVLYAIGLFVNALPEELFFRGLLLPRLERVFGNPLNALVASALFFNALHLPIDIYQGTSPSMALLDIFNTGYPSGLVWGYLYLRTRSIWPGTFWHAANMNLGFILMSL